MAMATAELEQQHIVQFGPDVKWFESIIESIAPVLPEARRSKEFVGVRAMYARLAREYEAEPTVPDHGGGVPGDRFPL